MGAGVVPVVNIPALTQARALHGATAVPPLAIPIAALADMFAVSLAPPVVSDCNHHAHSVRGQRLQGNITHWNDTALLSANPKLASYLPHEPITVQ